MNWPSRVFGQLAASRHPPRLRAVEVVEPGAVLFALLGRDAAIPRKDSADLVAASEVVVRYVDQYLAHADGKPRGDLRTYADLDTAVDLMGDLFRRYANLLTAGSYVTLVPVLQEDWLAIFRQPWIPTALEDPA